MNNHKNFFIFLSEKNSLQHKPNQNNIYLKLFQLFGEILRNKPVLSFLNNPCKIKTEFFEVLENG